MFEYSILHWSTFFSAAILLNLSPGPDMAFILGHSAKDGIKVGFFAMFGIWFGTFIHIIFASLGLSAIVATSAIAFLVVKWIGALYLIWLGISAILSKTHSSISTKKEPPVKDLVKVFKQGILVSLLNPKVAIFFLAFLPQFVEVGAGSTSAQLFLHGILIIVVAAFIEPPLILIGGKVANYLKNNTKVSNFIDKGLGALFIALGIKLAFIQKS